MFFKHIKRHGHGHGRGHGHHKKSIHGGKHEKFGHHFKHHGPHMGREFYKGKHHRGMDGLYFDRGCFSESELPDTTASERNVAREFFMRRHHWKQGRGHCEKCDCFKTVEENVETGVPAITDGNLETGEKNDAPVTPAEDVDGQEKNKDFPPPRYFRHHGRRGFKFSQSCPRCSQEGDKTTEKEATTQKEGGVQQGCVGKHYWKHHGGKRGHGFKRPCLHCFQGAGTGATQEGNAGVEDGTVRYMHKRRHHYGGKWGHGHKHGHRGWRRHGWHGVVMVDAAVNTGDAQEDNPGQTVANEGQANASQVMEQETRDELGQEQTNTAESAEVLEVVDNLRKSSLE